jgi:choloylglycine hydrolase
LCAIVSASVPGRACTTVFLHRGETALVANNYDYYAADGRVIVNRRGLRKTAFDTNSGLQWVSRYGSVVFEQWGLEFPNGGMNEAGLVVEQMMLDATQFPSAYDARPGLTELQWIQYQLDSSSSVAEVLATDARIRISTGSTPIHFLIADAAGQAAVIEFLGGRMVVHTGATLPMPALTNDTYEASIAYAAITPPERASHVSSLGRFVHATAAADTFARTTVDDPVGYAFAALDNVTQPNWTRWNTVCDIGRRKVYFRTQPARTIKEVSLADVDFRPSAEIRMVDINAPVGGAVILETPYSREDNLALLLSVFRQTTPSSTASYSYIQRRAFFPDSVDVEPYAPVILHHPESQTIAPGADLVLSVNAVGAPSILTYRWSRDGEPLVGTEASTLTLAGVGTDLAGRYSVSVSNGLGTAFSRESSVTVATPTPGRLVNMSTRAVAGLNGQPLIVGLVASGGPKRVLVRAVGPSLRTLFAMEGALPDPRLEVHRSTDGQDDLLAANDDWAALAGDCDTLRNAFACVGAFPLPASSRDAAMVLDVDGARTFHASGNHDARSGIVLVEAYDTGGGDTGRFINLSTRNHVGAGADVLVVGFVINGNTPKRLLVRGVGPSLGPLFGIPGVLADPVVELHTKRGERDVVVARNDDWSDEPGAHEVAKRVGAFALPAGSKDAALVVCVPAGAYTAVLSGAGGESGEGLLEVYEVE